jgi:hypothetical protein
VSGHYDRSDATRGGKKREAPVALKKPRLRVAEAVEQCVRPNFVSRPLLPPGLDYFNSCGDHWTIRSAQTRLDKGNEPWEGYAKASKSLTAAMKTLGFKP